MRRFLLVFCLTLTATLAQAGSGASGCADLSGFAEQPRIDFARDVLPILSGCPACHGAGGAAGLDLRPERAYDELVGVVSATNPQRRRVVPFDPGASLLLDALNCTVTGGPAFQMPGATPAQRAVIRDWIAQGAKAVPAPVAVPGPQVAPLGLLVLLLLINGARAVRVRNDRLRRVQ